MHWAYTSYFVTGWYKINDERCAFVLRTSPRWSSCEAKLHEDGSPDIAYTFRVPVTLGANQLDFEDLPVNIWFLKFDRLGLAYNYSTTGEPPGIKFVFRSLYEL